MKGRFATPLVVAACLLWLASVTAGLATLWTYANTPGPAATASDAWPGASRLRRDPHRPTLVMLVHPQCSCSRASIGELAVLMAHVQGRVTAHVLFYRPIDAEPGWEQTDLWRSAAAIPGVEVTSDEQGEQAAAFGAFVSGQVLFFDAEGHLMFAGGITFARGHSGDNSGRSAIEALLTAGPSAPGQTPVFGCLLREAPASQ